MSHTTDSSRLIRIDALGVLDATGLFHAPASVLIEISDRFGPKLANRVLAVGRSAEIDAHEASRSPRLERLARPRSVLLPGFVNAHTHLDLTHIGPQLHDPAMGFVPWVDMVRRNRRSEPEQIAESVRLGIDLSLAAGVVAVGDIAGAPAGQITITPWETLADSPMLGASFLEFFGIGKGEARTLAQLDRVMPMLQAKATFAANGAVRVGLQPHAPNTVSLKVYRRAVELAAQLGQPPALSTHLAETREERQFIAEGRGPQREMLERLGVWDDQMLEEIGFARHPVEHLEPVLASSPFVVAHVNDATDLAIEILAETNACVAYCPRASDYFGAHTHFAGHRYRDMIGAGVPVAIGTDSVINLPGEAGRHPQDGGAGMSVLDELRFLHRRDGADPLILLQMGTTNGALALGLEPGWFCWKAGGPIAGIVAVEVGGECPRGESAAQLVMGGSKRPELLLHRKDFTGTGIARSA